MIICDDVISDEEYERSFGVKRGELLKFVDIVELGRKVFSGEINGEGDFLEIIEKGGPPGPGPGSGNYERDQGAEKKIEDNKEKEWKGDFRYFYKNNTGGKKNILSLTDPKEVKRLLDFVIMNMRQHYTLYFPKRSGDDYKRFWSVYFKDEINYYKSLLKQKSLKSFIEHTDLALKGGPPGPGPGSGNYPRAGHTSTGKSEKSKVESHIRYMIQEIWDKNFPSKKVQIDTEYKKKEDGSIQIATEFKSKGFIKGDTVMMSTIYPGKNVVHDDYFLDDNRLKKKGFSSSYIKYIEEIAEKKGAKIAILQASSQGRYTWPKLGFKASDRKQYLDIVAFGKSKGIEIKNEMDFYKLKDYFDKGRGKELVGEDIMMKKPVGKFPEKKKSKSWKTNFINKYGDEKEHLKWSDYMETEIYEDKDREKLYQKEIIGEWPMALNKKVEKAVKKEVIKKDRNLCPLCGWELEDGWCVNPDCEVLDDSDDYR